MEDVILVKIIVVGDSNVGKTSFLNQYCWKQYDLSSSPTMGCDFTSKTIILHNQKFKLQLWDIAGQEKFQSISKLFVRGALGCIIVCDISDGRIIIHYQKKERTLNNTISWKDIVQINSEFATSLPIILIQNKFDLVEQSSEEELKNFQKKEYLNCFAQSQGFSDCFQISVKNSDVLDHIMIKLLDTIILNKMISIDRKESSSNFDVTRSISQLSHQAQKKKSACC